MMMRSSFLFGFLSLLSSKNWAFLIIFFLYYYLFEIYVVSSSSLLRVVEVVDLIFRQVILYFAFSLSLYSSIYLATYKHRLNIKPFSFAISFLIDSQIKTIISFLYLDLRKKKGKETSVFFR